MHEKMPTAGIIAIVVAGLALLWVSINAFFVLYVGPTQNSEFRIVETIRKSYTFYEVEYKFMFHWETVRDGSWAKLGAMFYSIEDAEKYIHSVKHPFVETSKIVKTKL